MWTAVHHAEKVGADTVASVYYALCSLTLNQRYYVGKATQ